VVISQLVKWREDVALDLGLSPREKDLRQQFVSRLLFQVERKYSETDLRKFMIDIVEDMEATDNLRANQSYGGLGPFLASLQEALTEVIEPHEDVIEFLREFTHFSSISSPQSLDAFAETRNYSDGREMEKASPMDADIAAESVAERLTAEAAEANRIALPLKNVLGSEDFLREMENLEPAIPLDFETPSPSESLPTEQSPGT
jgi:hypothetical protein